MQMYLIQQSGSKYIGYITTGTARDNFRSIVLYLSGKKPFLDNVIVVGNDETSIIGRLKKGVI